MSNVVLYQFNTSSAVAEWIAQKRTIGSARTAKEYERTMESFQRFITGAGRDVLPITAQTQEEVSRHAIDIARLAGIWANQRVPARLKADGTESARFDAGSPVSPSMYNQRLAILSSFYAFVQDTYKLAIPNPVKDVKRRRVQAYADAAANALPPDEVDEGLESIDRSTPEGLRDYALLAVALYTGRRASEIAGLHGQDVKLQGRGANIRIHLTFRAKGNKMMHDLLDTETSAVFPDYLHIRFSKHLQTIPPGAPI
jgi:integrase